MIPDKIKSVEDIISDVCKADFKIIGVDGPDGSGKTTFLTPKLAKITNAQILSLDTYLKKHNDEYFNCLNFIQLASDLAQTKDGSIIIEGILLLKVLEKLGIKTDYMIYVTDNTWLYDWNNEYGQYYNLELDRIITKVEEQCNKINYAFGEKTDFKLKGLKKELYEYSYKYKPIDKANSILITNF